jgi:putative OPT family oligopeptide transporter
MVTEITTTKVEGLPENAFTELKSGETYEPLIPAGAIIEESSTRAIIIGIIMTIIFSGAIAYITLKTGNGMEAAIPISILAVGLANMFKRKNTILENMMIIAIGSTSGIVVGGAVFVLPAIFVLGYESMTSIFQIFFVSFLGSVLGVLFLSPLQSYFVKDMHGKLPFPEATATTEVLVAGEKGGNQAKILVLGALVGGLYDFIVISFGAWREEFTTALMPAFNTLTNKFKVIFTLDGSAALLGMGYIIGLRYAAIIMAGSFLSWWVFVPFFAHLGAHIPAVVPAQGVDVAISSMGAEDIFFNYVRFIGIGGIFAAGIISILKFMPIIFQAIKGAIIDVLLSKKEGHKEVKRTEKEMSMTTIVALMVAIAVALFFYFRYSVLASQMNATSLTIVSLLITFIIAFLFTSVSAWAIAMISVTPISGMTLTTLLLGAFVLFKMGLSGPEGIVAALLVGGVVCTSLSMAGSLITQFKMSYWLGATPRKIQYANIFGSVIAAIVTALVIILLNKTYGFAPSPEHPNPLPAPQANAMAAVIQGIMGNGHVPFFLYGIGAVVAVIMEMIGISPLAFALGMYIPFGINMPILVGALIAHFVRKNKNEAMGKKQYDKGILITSGFIAGGALMGIISSLLSFAKTEYGIHIITNMEHNGATGNIVGIILFICLSYFVYAVSKRVKG